MPAKNEKEGMIVVTWQFPIGHISFLSLRMVSFRGLDNPLRIQNMFMFNAEYIDTWLPHKNQKKKAAFFLGFFLFKLG